MTLHPPTAMLDASTHLHTITTSNGFISSSHSEAMKKTLGMRSKFLTRGALIKLIFNHTQFSILLTLMSLLSSDESQGSASMCCDKVDHSLYASDLGKETQLQNLCESNRLHF
jgi:hypothetical protein